MQDAIKLKDTLLSTNLFIDNNYLADYISLVSNSTITDSYTEKHQVIQVAYYKHLYKCNRETAEKYADTDPNNFIVQLSYRDHCKAH